MNFNNLHKIFTKFAFLASLLLLTNQCGIWDPADARKVPVNAKDRMAKNIEEGKSIRFSKLGKGGGSGVFEFASSNELWRATLDILDFMSFSNVDLTTSLRFLSVSSKASLPCNRRNSNSDISTPNA